MSHPTPTISPKGHVLTIPGTVRPRLYLAGPIRNSYHNFKERFEFAEEMLRTAGYNVFNPVRQDDMLERSGVPLEIRTLLKHDLAWICDWAQAVALLDGWQNSTGALAEFWTATACGITTWHLPLEYQL